MKQYDHKKIEEKWRKRWKEEGLYRTEDPDGEPKKPKQYVLDEFPYPSGEGLHVGHTRIYTASDVYARMKRMQGFNVLHPSGWDAFGLPAERYAIKNKVHPSQSVKKNTERYKEQMDSVGLSYDWEREVNTTDPKFYKWTQWIFLQMYKRGLAYQSFEPVNWCPTCQTGLANEDLEGGNCERCGTPVEKRPMRQWVLRITDYADRLIKDLDALKWSESIKEAQKNWIGKNEGVAIKFSIFPPACVHARAGNFQFSKEIEIFTTRPDTLFGATYVAISAELAKRWLDAGWDASTEVKTFIKKTLADEAARTYGEIAEKEGMSTGVFAENPATNEKIPVWIANYVLSGVGTGAIMAVPAHDTRDFDFAKKYNLPVKAVIWGADMLTKEEKEKLETHRTTAHIESEIAAYEERIKHSGAYTGGGYLINSGEWSGMKNDEAWHKVTDAVGGKPQVTYKLRDWVFSRQRYWGEPIPVVCDPAGEVYPVDESELPVVLPQVDSYAPTGTGESPLADIKEWVEVEGYLTEEKTFKARTQARAPLGVKMKLFRRETNTMPQWAGSSWYWLRFMDPHNDKELVAKEREAYFAPVDMYVGGAEHVTRHLIYARFWHKFLYDLGVVSTLEPFLSRKGVGLVLGAGGAKMSKRLGNVLNPDEVIRAFGADTLRVYEMFMGPFEQAIAWSTDNVVGARRFIERAWKIQSVVSSQQSVVSAKTEELYHQTVKKVTEDIEGFKFNTAIAQLMILLNAIEKEREVPRELFEGYLKLLAPFAPFVAEELWSELGHTGSLHKAAWPTFNPEKTEGETMTIAIQVNGKLRDTMEVARNINEESVKTEALARPNVQKWLGEESPKKVIYVPGKVVNIVL